MNRITLGQICAAMFFCCGLFFTIEAQETEQTRLEKWREDVRFYAAELPARHKNLFFQLSKNEFERELKELENDLPKLSDDQIKLRLMRLTAKAGDGHTAVYWDKFEDMMIFPLRLRQFSEGFYVVETLPAYKEITGKKLIKIGKVKTEDAARRVRSVFAAENEFGVKDKTPLFLTVPFVLKADGIIENAVEAEFTFADEKGNQSKVKLTAEKFLKFMSGTKIGLFEENPPLALKNASKNYWFEYLPAQKTLYLAYNVCREDKTKSFAEMTREIFEVVDKNPTEKFVIDLRRNGGGNSAIIFPLYEELKKRPALTEKGKLFVLTSRSTFSSGTLNAVELKRRFDAVWVGEPSSQAPVVYGEIKFFDLPNSKLRVQYSTKRFVYDENEKRAFMPVDLATEDTFADFAAGRDKTLESVFNYRRK